MEKQGFVFSNVLTMSTTIEVVCYKYKPLKNKELPLKIRICKDRKIRYINLGVSTKPEHWDFVKNHPEEECPNKEYLEQLISSKISLIRSKIVELKANNIDFTATSLVEKLINPQKPLTVGDLFKQHIHSLEDEKRTRYAVSVKLVYNSLLKFNKHLDIYFPDIDFIWLKRYEAWLRKKGNAENTIGIRFRTLRMLYNLAIEMDIVKPEFYPFHKFKVSRLQQSTAKRAITKKEVQTVINYGLEGKDYYTCLAVSLFTFSYYMAGINFVDMAYLTEKNIIDNRLVYRRKKTKKLINLPLQQKAIMVLSRFRNNDGSYLFPILSAYHKTEQQKQNRLHKVITKVNKVLTEIGIELRIPVKLTTYVARHSFATVLKRSGVSTSLISESLGHSSERVTQYYLDSFENEAVNNALRNL